VRKKTLKASAASVADFRHEVRRLTGRRWGVVMRYRMVKLAQ